MKTTRKITFFVLLIALAISQAAGAANPVRLIARPLLTNPAVVVMSESGSFKLVLRPGYRLDSAELIYPESHGGETVPMTFSAAGDGEYTLNVPASYAKPALYGLGVKASKGSKIVKDMQPRSVWIMESVPDEIVFAHVSDTHAGDPRASLSPSRETAGQRRAMVYRAAVDSGAQFIVITGDIASVPGNYVKEYGMAYSEFRELITVPLFLTTGNHDLYTMSATSTKPDGKRFWSNYFGPEKYSFDIGEYTFIAINTYDWPRTLRNFMRSDVMKEKGSYAGGAISEMQREWIENRLRSAAENHNTIICMGHHDPGVAFTRKDTSGIDGLAQGSDLIALFEKYDVDYYLAGHEHSNHIRKLGPTEVHVVTSASSHIGDGDSWGFALCRLGSGRMNCEYNPVVFRTTDAPRRKEIWKN